MAKPYRRVKTTKSEIFLTFDDGPCPHLTPQILDLLDEEKGRATFFVIAEKAAQNKSLTQEIVKRGHSLGDHSLDHAFSHFFKREEHLKDWLESSHKKISDVAGVEPIAFRSPAGVVTPPLRRVIDELGINWVHWNRRFFDTQFSLRMLSGIYNYQHGDILLLHDQQKAFLRLNFLKNLRSLLHRLSPLELKALTGETIYHGS